MDRRPPECVSRPNARRYLFVAIDRATRWVFIRVFPAKTAANARRFLRDLERACPIRIRTILTERAMEGGRHRGAIGPSDDGGGSSPMASGKEFTDRLFGLRQRAATGQHEFDRLCAEFEIEHRRSGAKQSPGLFRAPPHPPKSPQTNGMAERFNGRIEEVLQSHHFRSGEELEATLHRYVLRRLSRTVAHRA